MIDPPSNLPRSEADPFSREWIAALPTSDAELCAIAPAVWLDRYGCVATGSHSLVRTILTDWRRFTSTAKPFDDPFSLVPAILVTEDPPAHTEVRNALMQFFTPAALATYTDAFRASAEQVVGVALEKGEIDAVTDIAAAFVLRVFPDMLGLPEEGRELIVDFGDAAFNTVGPINDIFRESFARAEPAFAWVDRNSRREAVRPGAIASKVLDLTDTGLPIERAELLVRSILAAGFDTTILGIANAIGAFAQAPEQWSLLRSSPRLLRGAFEEMLRYDPPARVQGRTVNEDLELEGVGFRRGDPIALFLTAAGRDPVRWDQPDVFDIRRKGANLGFGAGIHLCLGQVLARMEFEALFNALLERVDRIEPTRSPTRFINNAAVGFKTLPVRLQSS